VLEPNHIKIVFVSVVRALMLALLVVHEGGSLAGNDSSDASVT
jgi:hypothetical protein